MAIEKIVEIKVNADQANKSLNQTEKDFKKVGTASSQTAEDIKKTTKSLKDITNSSDDVGKKLKDLDAVIASTPKSFKELAKQIQAYQTIALQAGRESAVGKEALRNAAALKDQMVDLQNETKRLADDNKNLQGVIGIGTGVLAGFTAYQGALGMIGVESEDLQKTMVKLQAAQSALSGVVQLQTAFQKESAAMLLINTARTKVATVVQAAYNAVMSANPIGAIITAIGALIAGITALIMNFESIMSFLGLIDDEEETLHQNQLARNREAQAAQDKKLKDLGKEKDELGKKHSFQERLMKAQGKSEEEIFQAIRKNRLERIKASLEFANQTKIKNDLLIAEFKLLQANGDLTKEEADRINAAIAENNKIIIDSNNERARLNEEIRIDDAAKETAAQNKKTEEVKKATQTQAEIRKKAQEKKEADEKAAREKEKAEREKEIADEKARLAKEAQDQAELLAQISQLEDEYLNSKISKEQQEINAVNDKYFATLEAARLAGEDTALLEEAQQQAILDIQKRYADEKKAVDKELDDKKKETAKEELLREQELQDAKLSLASESLGAIANLVTAFAGKSEESQRRAFKITKAMNIAQAVMDTYKGANAIFASAAANPSTILFPAQPFITAGIAIASGLANVATIARTEFNGGGGTPPGGPPPPNAPNTATSQPANFNVVGNTGTNQLADTLGSSPMKAYVVAGDVTSAQSLERNKIQQSTL